MNDDIHTAQQRASISNESTGFQRGRLSGRAMGVEAALWTASGQHDSRGSGDGSQCTGMLSMAPSQRHGDGAAQGREHQIKCGEQ